MSASPEFVIRTYDPEGDYSAVQANLLQAGLYDEDRDTAERLARFADDVIVATIGEQVVGSVYVVNHVVPTIWRLVVGEAHRGQGIGTALLEAAKIKLAEGGARDVEGFFAAGDEELRRWYEARGMRDGGEYRSVWSYVRQCVTPGSHLPNKYS